MLFLALLLYEAVWVVGFVGLGFHGFVRDAGVPAAAVPAVVFAACLLVVLLFLFVVHSYQPEWKRPLLKLVRLDGVRWLALLTACASCVALGAALAKASLPLAAVFLPMAAVSLANGFRIEKIPALLMPDTPDVPPPVIPEPVAPDLTGHIVRDIEWSLDGQPYTLRVVLRRDLYEELLARPRVPDLSRWPEEYVVGGVCPEIRDAARKLMALGHTWSTWEEAGLVLSFVQNAIRYEFDHVCHPGHQDWPKYPVESLGDETGDCEDSTFLGAALLAVMGYDCAMLILPGHAALGVAGAGHVDGHYYEHHGRRYYYCESTAGGWKVGQLPDKYQGVAAEVYPIPLERLLPEV